MTYTNLIMTFDMNGKHYEAAPEETDCECNEPCTGCAFTRTQDCQNAPPCNDIIFREVQP